MRYTMCGWCRRFNPTTIELCRQCGHEAHVARAHCACAHCQATRAGTMKALPEPDHVLHGRLAFARWLVSSGRLTDQL
ncbi:MAG TPA: hypothetical protein VK066_08265 [Chloroflexota bacterium]|nr:hypothetical protein [Chloroflexota bacterium]